MGLPRTDSDLIDAWLNSQGTDETRRSYRPVIDHWLGWITTRDVGLRQITRADADTWRLTVEATPTRSGRPPAPRTVARKLATVSSLYAYLEADGEIERSPFAHVTRPKVDRRYGVTPALTAAEADRILDAAQEAGPRTHVAVSVLLATAIRADELLTLDVERIRVRSGVLTVAVHRKGGKHDVLPLHERVADDVEALRGERRRGPLLAGAAGGAWTYAQLNYAVAAAGRAAGIAERVTPHMLRATWATLALDAGVSLATVQDVMGHASSDTTRLYDRGRDLLNRKVTAVEAVAAHIRGARVARGG